MITLSGNKKVFGTMRGYDPFMNLVLEDTLCEIDENEKKDVGSIVSHSHVLIRILAIYHMFFCMIANISLLIFPLLIARSSEVAL